MYKQLGRQPWTCARCMRRLSRLGQSRQISSLGSGSIPNTAPPVSTKEYAPISEPNRLQDDSALRSVFDSTDFWNSFSRGSIKKPGGLVQNHYIKTPNGFQEFTLSTLARCKRIVQRVLASSSIEEYKGMVRDLDQLSDLLCRVIDLSDFMRATHPDPRYVDSAHRAYAAMFEYMNELNTNAGLNAQLKKAFSIPEVVSHWSEEEKIVGQILMKEFSNSAIDLPANDRRRFVDLSNDISMLGTEFVSSPEPAQETISVDPKKLNGLEPITIRKYTRWNGKAEFPTYSPEAAKLVYFAHDEDVRRAVYIAHRSSSKAQIQRLEQLLHKRAELASLSGHRSFAHMTLSDKMAKSPEAVERFLSTLNATNKPSVEAELKRLQSSTTESKIEPWNYAYLMRQYEQANYGSRSSRSRSLSQISSYFSLGTVMQGISRLVTQLYGVRLEPRETPPGETWSPEVRRLDVVHETEGTLAIIYCDLFSRANKSPHPAHFTLRCSRELSPDELARDLPNDGMPTSTGPSRITGEQVVFQLPVIALVCDFADPTRSSPSLLSLHNVVTLFHEMGHAVHSILGRTSLQSISGTRCPTDFAELPSVLMESFATDPTVLSLYARHWSTGAPMSPDMITAMLRDNASQAEIGGAMANEAQIKLSFLDQAYHSLPPTASFDSTAIYHDIWARHGSLAPEPAGTSWQGAFGHLFGYGATYYSYLFDRAIARRVWQQIFRAGRDQGAIDREAGEQFKNSVLRWGGGRDPWICLEDLLGKGEGVLAEGKERAMLEVGKWGVGVGEGDAVGL